MNKNPLLQLQSFGQSIWLDFISRGMLDSGDLLRLIIEDGVTGSGAEAESGPGVMIKRGGT